MDAPLLVASSRTHAPPSDSSSIRRSTAIYMSYAVAHLVILGCWIAPWGGEWLWTAGSHQWSHNPEAVNSNASTRDGFAAASKIVLTLVEVSLVWDNFIVGVGRSVLAKCGIDVLRRASYPRFLAHAALTPLLLIVVASRADRAGGVPWLNCAGGCAAAAAAAGLDSATDSAEANSIHCSGTIGMWVLLGIGVALAVVGLVHFFLTFDELAIAGSSQISNSQISADVIARRGNTPLIYAIEKGDEEVALALVANEGFNLNVKDKYGVTPLHLACRFSQKELAFALVANEAVDVNATDNNGKTPLDYATHERVVACLLGRGAKHKTHTNLLEACKEESTIEAMRLLGIESTPVNAQDEDGMTALHIAYIMGLKEVALALLARTDLDDIRTVDPVTAAAVRSRSSQTVGLDDDDDDDDDERKPNKLPPPQKKKCAALTKLGSGLVRFTASEPKPKPKPPQGEDPSFCRRKGVTLAIMIGPAVFVVLVAIVVGLWIAAGDRERPRDQLTSLPTIAGIVLAVCSFIMFACAAGPPVFTLFSGNFGEVVLAMGLVASGRLLMLP